jgi:hypothetical protein
VEIAVISLAHYPAPEDAVLRDVGFNNKWRYGKKHGYKFIGQTKLLDERRPPSWSKIKLVLKAFREGHDCVFWLDADTLVMDQTRSLSDFMHSQHDMIVTADANGPSLASFLIRKTPATVMMLWDVWNSPLHADLPGGEAESFRNIVDLYDHHCDVLALPRKAMNSKFDEWQEGDFVINLSGLDMAKKRKFVKEYADKVK